jgi:signal transduction histidine kinase
MSFLRDKFLFIILDFIIAGFSALLLLELRENLFIALFTPALFFTAAIFSLIPEYYAKSKYLNNLKNILEQLDEKYLLSEIIEKPNFFEGVFFYNMLKPINKSMNDEIAKYKFSSIEYREFVELWVHEIKTPIAGAKLICENSRNAELSYELDKIENFVEQALYYARSNNVEKDYLIKRVSLASLVNSVLRTDAGYLIANKIKIQTEGLELEVFTDSKWVAFIIRQIIGNSVKYGCTLLKFGASTGTNSVLLRICDDGCGIPETDVAMVFDKGFTGENGRRFSKSTGLGLYLCKQMCAKLGLGITLESAENEGTTVEIIFPKSEVYFG